MLTDHPKKRTFWLLLPETEPIYTRLAEKKWRAFHTPVIEAQKTIILTKKILLSRKPSYLSEKLTSRSSTTTRSGISLFPLQASLTLSREGFLYRGTKLFNMLPEETKKENKMSRFKKETTSWVRGAFKIKNWQNYGNVPNLK